MKPIAILTCITILAAAGIVAAEPDWLPAFKSYYGVQNGARLDTCDVCHVPGQPFRERNPYGIDLKDIGDIGNNVNNAFAVTDTLDSDNDTWKNGVEIAHDTFPGDPTDIVPVENTSWGKIKALYGN
jgi:hypothetical protein